MLPRPTLLTSAAALALAACASAGAPRSGPPPGAGERPEALVGRTWDVRAGQFVDDGALDAALRRADLVLVGETHDNPEHHRIEARLVRALSAGGRRPAVAFEMLDPDQQAPLDAARARAPRDPDALAQAVDWAHRGWPDFALYRPVFAAALDAGLPIAAANLPRRDARAVVAQGASALEPAPRALLERAGPLSPEAARDLRREMAEQHCGALPASMLDGMVLMQRARDAQLAARLLAAAGPGGAVLVAGAGHVRDDRGVPAYLAAAEPPRPSLAVAMVEVAPGADAPAAYAQGLGAARLPFDYVIFTHRQQREDPCEGLRQAHPTAPAPARDR